MKGTWGQQLYGMDRDQHGHIWILLEGNAETLHVSPEIGAMETFALSHPNRQKYWADERNVTLCQPIMFLKSEMLQKAPLSDSCLGAVASDLGKWPSALKRYRYITNSSAMLLFHPERSPWHFFMLSDFWHCMLFFSEVSHSSRSLVLFHNI